jgi:predicted PurR-regulated permease PerM
MKVPNPDKSNEAQKSAIREHGEEPQQELEPVRQIDINQIEARTLVKIVVVILAVLVVVWFLYSTLSLLLLLFLGLLVATAIDPIVTILRRGPFNRTYGVLVVYVGIFLLVGLLGWLTLPIAFEQISELGGSASRTVTSIKEGAKDIDNSFLRQQALTFADALDSISKSVQPSSTTSASPEEKVQTVAEATITVAEIFFAIITIFVVAFYWYSERILLKQWVISWFPTPTANRIKRIWDDVETTIGDWVRGQLLLMAIVGLISAGGYFIIGVDYWPALALFIAIAEAIPLVGPYIGTAPAVLVALTQPDGGLGKALLVVLFAIVLQTVEGNVLVPRVMKNSVGISPLLVIVSILFGAAIAGLAGALVAVPLAGTLQIIIDDIKQEREGEEKLEEAIEEGVIAPAESE